MLYTGYNETCNLIIILSAVSFASNLVTQTLQLYIVLTTFMGAFIVTVSLFLHGFTLRIVPPKHSSYPYPDPVCRRLHYPKIE